MTISYSKVYRKDGKEYALYPSLFLKESNLLSVNVVDLTKQNNGEEKEKP